MTVFVLGEIHSGVRAGGREIRGKTIPVTSGVEKDPDSNEHNRESLCRWRNKCLYPWDHIYSIESNIDCIPWMSVDFGCLTIYHTKLACLQCM